MARAINDLTKRQRAKREAIILNLEDAKDKLPMLKAQHDIAFKRYQDVQQKHERAMDQLLNFDKVHGLVGQTDG